MPCAYRLSIFSSRSFLKSVDATLIATNRKYSSFASRVVRSIDSYRRMAPGLFSSSSPPCDLSISFSPDSFSILFHSVSKLSNPGESDGFAIDSNIGLCLLLFPVLNRLEVGMCYFVDCGLSQCVDEVCVWLMGFCGSQLHEHRGESCYQAVSFLAGDESARDDAVRPFHELLLPHGEGPWLVHLA